MRPQYTRIARVVKPHGTSGFFYVEPYQVEDLDCLEPGNCVCIVPPQNDMPRWTRIDHITKGREAQRALWRVHLDALSNRTQVEHIVGAFFLVEKTRAIAEALARAQSHETPNKTAGTDLVELDLLQQSGNVCKDEDDFLRASAQVRISLADEAFMDALIEDEVVGPVGTIASITDNGAHTLWEIKNAAGSFLFPAVPAYVYAVALQTSAATGDTEDKKAFSHQQDRAVAPQTKKEVFKKTIEKVYVRLPQGLLEKKMLESLQKDL